MVGVIGIMVMSFQKDLGQHSVALRTVVVSLFIRASLISLSEVLQIQITGHTHLWT